MSIYSTNEWDPLKKVVVGVADYARIPEMDKSLRCVNYADRKDVSNVASGLYPTQVIEESNEDLEIFVEFLKNENVEVVRPNRTDKVEYYNYCPRDTVFVYKDRMLATPMSLKARRREFLHMLPHVGGVEMSYVCNDDDLYNEECIGDPNKLALTNVAPCFDAANAIRANDDILYLVSNSGNLAGAKCLDNWVNKPKYKFLEKGNIKVHTLEGVYSYMHIDSTIAFLREGLLLANPSRIKNKDVLPAPFNKWDIIWAPDPVDVGHYPEICNSSIWTWNVNLFSINPNLVVLEKHQEPTRKALEAYGIECAMLPLRHARTLGGCFHCCTLDLIREVR
jgi:N-dimethylarginine dimethylaminohydrolase